MTDREIDRVIESADAPAPDSKMVERVKTRILSSMPPVRPLPPGWAFFCAFLLAAAAVAAMGVSRFGMLGWDALSRTQRVILFSVITAAACATAAAGVREMRPAGGRRIGGATLGVVLAALIAAAAMPGEYSLAAFVRRGWPCLRAGLIVAAPAALILCLIARRGYVLSLTAAGLALGSLAGLAGIAMLEAHCPIVSAMHVMVWHAGVVAVSGVFGGVVGAVLARWRK